jgi:hypothetical protein
MLEATPAATNAERRAVLLAKFEERLLELWPDETGGRRVPFADCAHEVVLPGAPFETLFGEWKAWLYDGKIDSLLRSLKVHARKFAERPARPSDLPAGSPGGILWAHVFYIERYRGHMDYPTYRKNGWPIGSGLAESLAGQAGTRMKAANKRWTSEGAEAMANLLAERRSQDGRWPAPLPRPEVLQPG